MIYFKLCKRNWGNGDGFFNRDSLLRRVCEDAIGAAGLPRLGRSPSTSTGFSFVG